MEHVLKVLGSKPYEQPSLVYRKLDIAARECQYAIQERTKISSIAAKLSKLCLDQGTSFNATPKLATFWTLSGREFFKWLIYVAKA